MFRYSLNEIYARYGIPMMVVENGLGAYDVKGEDGMVHDTYRIDYLRQHMFLFSVLKENFRQFSQAA